jgi:hypothetical protein
MMFAGWAEPETTKPLTRASPMFPHPIKHSFFSINLST